MWSVLKNNSTHYFSNPNQDPIVEFNEIKKIKFYPIGTKSGSFGVVFSKT